ncbi:MAG: hypothetical protein ACERKN_05035 [Velocimicrobium sp.]
MIYVEIAVGIILLVFIKIRVDKRKLEAKLNQQLEETWGQVPIQEYTYEKLASIPKYYETKKNSSLDVDDITWNDLDMDRIYMLLNHTESSIGEEYLYSMLRKIQYSLETLDERNRLITFFSKHANERKNLQKKLRMMGKLKDVSFYEYINRVDALESHKPYLHFFCMLSFPASIASTLISGVGAYAFGLIFASVAFNIIVYYKRKAKIEIFFNVFSYILRSLAFMQEISETKIPELHSYFEELSIEVSNFKRFRRGSSLVISKNAAGSVEDILLDYLRMLFHFDLIKFDFMLKELRDKKENLNHLFEIIGILDSCIAVSSFRQLMNDEYCIPVFLKETCSLQVEEVYHPLIIHPIKNTILTNRSVILTGSNASGKSTFIKTIAINAILAQTINTSLSKSYTSGFFKIYSSMALRDDIMSQESYYIVEIKSLKRIYDESGMQIPILCFIDEVLRGTNTAERIAASGQILKSLSFRNALVFAATHDVELTYILDAYYQNFHFEERIEGNNVLFDYQLRDGRASSRNAIKLLGMMGYTSEIIDMATNEVNHFLKTNTWNTL